MKPASQIVKEQLKQQGLELAEETVKKVFEVIEAHLIPALAAEAEEANIRSLASILKIVIDPLKPVILKAIDKIDGQEG